jgi:hypothetical protein
VADGHAARLDDEAEEADALETPRERVRVGDHSTPHT